jgi:hypothetical protein
MIMRQNSITEHQTRTQLSDLRPSILEAYRTRAGAISTYQAG